MRASFLLLFILSLSTNLLDKPPRDLLSLLDAEACLQHLNIQTDEANLQFIASGQVRAPLPKAVLQQAANDLGAEDFRVRKQAKEQLLNGGEEAIPLLLPQTKHEDPEVSVTARNLVRELRKRQMEAERNDFTYAKRLLAIKQLGEQKSETSVAMLEALLTHEDMGLRDTAQQALNRIRGIDDARPTGIETLISAAATQPANAGIVAMVDVEKGAEMQTMIELLKPLGQNNPTAQMMLQSLHTEEGLEPLITALQRFGNPQVDSITMAITKDLGENGGAIAFTFKGHYDIDRWDRSLQAMIGMGKRTEQKGLRLFFDRNAPSICLVDKSTLLIVAGPNMQTPNQALALIEDMLTVKPPGKAASAALALVQKPDSRLVVAGAASAEQRAFFVPELDPEIQRLIKRQEDDAPPNIELQALQLVRSMLDMEHIEISLSTKGRVEITSTAKDEQQAKELAQLLSELHDNGRNMLIQFASEAPPEMKKMLADIQPKIVLASITRNGTHVRIDMDEKILTQATGIMSLLFMR